MAAVTCRICSGPLRLLHPGTLGGASASALAPTNHLPGMYADLFACARCGSVQQPALPRGAALLDLYRGMRDDDYLAEEAGRRRTARRLLARLGAAPGAGGARLLEVGCGHGLLLDEARRLGWTVRGLDLSKSAAGHARDTLDLDVAEIPVEDPALDGEAFDAIVLADVVEHLDDPLATLRRCRSLLAPGGALLIVTPDPSSRTARLAGARWWGFLPAHTCLIPRAELRRIVAGLGLAVVDDVSLVRSFTPAYWVRGLIERGGRLPGPARAALARMPERPLVSLSLGDERVVVAREGLTTAPGRSRPPVVAAEAGPARG
jgi:SAM-dependent methyltransferase